MKLLKLLSIPTMAVGMLALLTATVSANHATVSAMLDCSSTTASKACLDVTISTSDFSQPRQLTFTLLGHKKGDAANKFSAVGTAQTLTFDNGLSNHQFQLCFDQVTTSDFDSFELKVAAVGSALDVNGKSYVNLGPFQNNCATPTPTPSSSPTATPTATPTMSPTPSPSNGGGSGAGSPSPSASANTTAALAETGGFDFRYPLIGLVLLVAGGALFVVSASRGRSAQTK